MDKHTPEQRRRNMQAVKDKDSQIEVMLRKVLYDRIRENATVKQREVRAVC
jgi:G:T-mismatch repair DNA endonuclease (very short patch repair protein)